MKKLLKVTALLIAAAAMFVGCKNNADDSTPEDDDKLVLFSSSDVSIPVTGFSYITLSDGDWTGAYEQVNKVGSTKTTRFYKAKFTVSDNGNTCIFTKWFEKETKEDSVGTASQDQLNTQKAYYESQGYKFEINGDKILITKTTDYNETQLATLLQLGTREFTHLPYSSLSVKTNEDNTKYYGREYIGTEETLYLMKN